jgi:hypothetical protein
MGKGVCRRVRQGAMVLAKRRPGFYTRPKSLNHFAE